ncbi:MAG: tetratricopeptide repeat protein [Acidobacteriota bacterium]
MLAAVAVLTACGHKSDSGKKRDSGSAGPAVAPLAMPAVGVDRVMRFRFIYGEGYSAYKGCAEKLKAKDFPAAVKACETAVDKDPTHLDAQRGLAVALANTGEPAAAVDHLVAALAADYYAYAPTLGDPDLESFRATPHGQAVAQLAQKIHDEYVRRIKTGLLVLGRRAMFRWPDKSGPQYDPSRGELYAYDRETRRYFRLTHTDHEVAAFVLAPSGSEVALLGFDKVDYDKTGASPPLLAHSWVVTVDTGEWKTLGPQASLPSSREVALGYAAGDKLLVSTAPATGRWTVGDATVSTVDRSTGKLTKAGDAMPVPRVVLNLDEARVVHGVPGVEAAWSNDPPTTTSMKLATGQAISIPESGQASESTVAVSPDGAHVAFATAVDPCAKDFAPSLYVADAKSGTLKHVLTARSRFATRWVDANVLAYEDGEGSIRLWDATSGREAQRLENKAGLALDVLSLANGPLCKQAPPEAGSGSSDELPPEEGAGPVTAPP